MDKALRGALAAIAVLVVSCASAAASSETTTASTQLSLWGVTCPTTTHCWAVGEQGTAGLILATTDGGTSWKVQLESVKSSLDVVTCTSVSHCWAGGMIWQRGVDDAPYLLATTDGGRNWRSHTLPRQMQELNAVACVDNLRCWAVGETIPRDQVVVAATTNGGATWRLEQTPKLYTSMSTAFAIACPSAKDCVVVGEGDMRTTNGGSSWQLSAITGMNPLAAISCGSTSDCVALSEGPTAVPTTESSAVATTTDGGRSWVLRARLPSVGILRAVSCASTTDCVAVGEGYTVTGTGQFPSTTPWAAIFGTTSGGVTWTRHPGPKVVPGLTDVSCASTKDCVAVGWTRSHAAAVIATTNGGRSWRGEKLP